MDENNNSNRGLASPKVSARKRKQIAREGGLARARQRRQEANGNGSRGE